MATARLLVAAVRRDDDERVRTLVTADPALANADAEVEAAMLLPHEGSGGYWTTPLLEAARRHAWKALAALAAAPGFAPNAVTRSATLPTTALADAARRGDAAAVRCLLALPGVDPAAGDTAVAHPAIYGALIGSVGVLDAFADAGAIPVALESVLLAVAAANGHDACRAHLARLFVASKPIGELPESDRPAKIKLVCAKYATSDGYGPPRIERDVRASTRRSLAPLLRRRLPRSVVPEVFAQLGAKLSHHERLAVLRGLDAADSVGRGAAGVAAAAHGAVPATIAVDTLVRYWLSRPAAAAGETGEGSSSSGSGAAE